MRGIVIDPGAKPELYRLPDTLQELQRFMGGYAQRCPIDNKFAALFYLPQVGQNLPTRHYNGRWFYGRLCLVGWRNARMTDLPMPLAEELLQKFAPCGGNAMNEYDAIRAAFAHNRKDAELLLHETVRSILAEATSNKVKQLEKISLCYNAADTGTAQRKALINMEVEG